MALLGATTGSIIPRGLYGAGSPWFVAVLDVGQRIRMTFWYEVKVNGPIHTETYDLSELPSSSSYTITSGGSSCGTATIERAKGLLVIRYGKMKLELAPTERATINSAIHQVEENKQYANLVSQGSGVGAWYYGSGLPKCGE